MKKTYLNLPIRNVAKTDAFFKALGLEKNKQFAGDDATNAIINNTTILMLIEDKRFASFIKQQPKKLEGGFIISLEFESKAEVDAMFKKALDAGATDTTNHDMEVDFMYVKAFKDINGHYWEFFVMVGQMPTK
jgi:predicted lactoylglutathione lyase